MLEKARLYFEIGKRYHFSYSPNSRPIFHFELEIDEEKTVKKREVESVEGIVVSFNPNFANLRNAVLTFYNNGERPSILGNSTKTLEDKFQHYGEIKVFYNSLNMVWSE